MIVGFGKDHRPVQSFIKNCKNACSLSDNTFYVVTTYQGAIWINKGTIKNK